VPIISVGFVHSAALRYIFRKEAREIAPNNFLDRPVPQIVPF
jgi:hypothetical protein